MQEAEIALFGFWQVLSWRLDPLFIVMGVVFAAAITLATQRLTATIVHDQRPSPPLRRLPVLMWRFVAYSGWILGRMVVAGVQIARITLSPRLPLDPVEFRFRTELASPMARTVFTNSITLVPGTLTVELEGQWVTVHALFPAAADDLVSGALQNRVARLFDEGPQPPATPTWLATPAVDPAADDPTDATLTSGDRAPQADLDDWDGQP